MPVQAPKLAQSVQNSSSNKTGFKRLHPRKKLVQKAANASSTANTTSVKSLVEAKVASPVAAGGPAVTINTDRDTKLPVTNAKRPDPEVRKRIETDLHY
jgi:hypothetical protein